MNSYFFRVKISWIKLALGGAMVFGIPLIYFFSSSDEEKTFTDSQNEFVEQTEQLIADLSKKTKVSSKSPKLSTEDNRTGPSITQTQPEALNSADPREELTSEINYTPVVDSLSEPQWKKELDIFLQGDQSPKEFLDSLTIDNWKEARDALALAYEEKTCPRQRISRIDSGRGLEKLAAKRWQRNYSGQAIQPSPKSSRDGQKERLRKCLIITLISISNLLRFKITCKKQTPGKSPLWINSPAG